MKRILIAVFSLLFFSIASSPLSAAHNLAKITIEGDGLSTAIEISEPGIETFTVWAGPGVRVDGVEQTEGFIIDWPKGVAEQPPAGLQRYRVSFYEGCRAGEWNCRAPGSALAYVVLYDYDPASQQGFVYLPGRDDELFQFNHTMWHGNGLEGNWFRARPEWDSYVSTRIANARAGGPGR